MDGECRVIVYNDLTCDCPRGVHVFQNAPQPFLVRIARGTVEKCYRTAPYGLITQAGVQEEYRRSTARAPESSDWSVLTQCIQNLEQ